MGFHARLDEGAPQNAPLLASLRRAHPDAAPLAAPSSHPDPYQRAGSHPDVVARVWDELGAAVPKGCRALVFGVPGLVHPAAGVVLALAWGTAYALRVPDAAGAEARAAGLRAERRWSTGETADLARDFGPAWLFGAWSAAEPSFVARAFAELAP